MMNNNWKQYITPPNMIVLAFMIYFVVLNERKMIVNTGPDPVTTEFREFMVETKTKIESIQKVDSIRNQKIVDYAKQIIKNNGDVDDLDDRAVDSLFAALTNGG